MLVYHHSNYKLFNNSISNASKHYSSSSSNNNNNSNNRKWSEVLVRHSSYRQLLVNPR
jgi:hypothetical protein